MYHWITYNFADFCKILDFLICSYQHFFGSLFHASTCNWPCLHKSCLLKLVCMFFSAIIFFPIVVLVGHFQLFDS